MRATVREPRMSKKHFTWYTSSQIHPLRVWPWKWTQSDQRQKWASAEWQSVAQRSHHPRQQQHSHAEGGRYHDEPEHQWSQEPGPERFEKDLIFIDYQLHQIHSQRSSSTLRLISVLDFSSDLQGFINTNNKTEEVVVECRRSRISPFIQAIRATFNRVQSNIGRIQIEKRACRVYCWAWAVIQYQNHHVWCLFDTLQVISSSLGLVQACMAICPNWWLPERASRAAWPLWTSTVACRTSWAMLCSAAGRLNVDAKVHPPSNLRPI